METLYHFCIKRATKSCKIGKFFLIRAAFSLFWGKNGRRGRVRHRKWRPERVGAAHLARSKPLTRRCAATAMRLISPTPSHQRRQRSPSVGALRKCAGGTFLASDRSGCAARREVGRRVIPHSRIHIRGGGSLPPAAIFLFLEKINRGKSRCVKKTCRWHVFSIRPQRLCREEGSWMIWCARLRAIAPRRTAWPPLLRRSGRDEPHRRYCDRTGNKFLPRARKNDKKCKPFLLSRRTWGTI